MIETMSLKGGIDTYSFTEQRYLTDESPFGRKVRYLDENGYDYEREIANKYFKKDDILTVKEIYVGRSSSTVEFVEIPSREFNTVMFQDME